ncbi:polysaccharide biosynthesis/export family protein [Loktanella sp. R86503]|uniref:polysaccharide biosynthesis/export family protein n=1 Tax=Loktanella sp. R86503 TaxID=3093847 RepID=UPI0036DAEDB3
MKLMFTTMARRAAGMLAATCLLVLATLTPAAAQQTYGLKAGDTLRVEVLDDPSMNRTVLIAPDGRISFPQAGTMRVAGTTVDAVQSELITRLTPSFAAPPTVFVSLERLADKVIRPIVQAPPSAPIPDPVISVFVVGEANKLGQLDVAPGTTAMQMFAVMGGFTKFAATKRVQLRRTDASGVEQVYTLNYRDIQRGLVNTGQTQLADGDVIVVPQRRLFE